MKLRIEVELNPDEVSLVTEVFKTLRQLTDHVKTRDAKKLFASILMRLQRNESQLDSVAADINAMLVASEESEEIMGEMIAAFEEIVFASDMVMRKESVVPFMHLLPRLPDRSKDKIKEVLIPKVVKHLTVKRPVDVSRIQFFSHAEAFAAFVDMEFIPLSGAIRSMTSLLRDGGTRSAAITMLGKTFELCLTRIQETCDPIVLAELRQMLQSVKDVHFQYDLNYIAECMGWNCGSVASSSHSQALPALERADTWSQVHTGGLYGLESYKGHSSTILAIVYDSKRDQLVTADKGGSLFVWSSEGQKLAHTTMPHYVCSMDIYEPSQWLLCCGMPTDATGGGRSACLYRYGAASPGWKQQGMRERKDGSKIISCVKAFRGQPAFVVGEAVHNQTTDRNARKVEDKLCYYEMQPGAFFSSMQPVRVYSGHEDLITSLCLLPREQTTFLSGSSDCTVRLWDRRVDRCIGIFGYSTGSGKLQSHSAMVTSLDAFDTTIVSAGMDSMLHSWDLRTLSVQGCCPISSLNVDAGILRIAMRPESAVAAISTVDGLYLADLSVQQPARPAEAVPEKVAGRYHDIKWSTSRNLLYAGGDGAEVDVYAFHM